MKKPTLLAALATLSLLAGCGSEVVDLRADGASESGSTSTGGALPSEVAKPRMVSAGLSHACGVTSLGAVKCWGTSVHGELGNGSTTESAAPVDVVGLSSGALGVAVGDAHSCAITAAGAVKCWGRGLVGALGNGSTIDSLVPVDVVGLSSGVVAISAGSSQTCAVTEAGALKCWGWNSDGQIGNDSTIDSPVPATVVGLSTGVRAVSVGGHHACAVTTQGAVVCWGDNYQGELGDGSTKDSLVPVSVVGLSSGVLSVSAGSEHSCAVTDGGALRCWGWNAGSQLGNGSTMSSPVPVAVGGLSSGVVGVAAATLHTCALTQLGAVECWGANFLGHLGNGSTIDSSAPGEVVGLSTGVLTVASGAAYTCAIPAVGAVKCWGSIFLDDGTNKPAYTTLPVDVIGL